MDPLIRVLVIDDSAFNRRVIADILEESGRARVVGVARDGEEGIKKAFDTRPDLITLDLEMPRMDGFTFLRIIMKSLPTPVLVISARHEDKNVFKALELGAVDFLAKPSDHLKGADMLRQDLLLKINLVSQLRIKNVQRLLNRESPPRRVLAPALPPPSDQPVIDLVAIGASTGGPSALQNVFSSLPTGLPTGFVVSQHMPAGFTRAFAERLGRNSNLAIKEAEDGDRVQPGHVLIAPGGFNMTLQEQSGEVRVKNEPRAPEDKYVPSVNELFRSAARIYGPRLLAVVLTGMGNDGRDGIVAVKEAGGRTLAESERTAIVFGMPREAFATQKVDRVADLDEMALEIVRECERGRKAS
ncbi:MAG: chemotaxis response regulator protein-glutamate methylesterase [Deltaproteobacteria bacterium RBG_13_61_14]|nr:MAG: chemotaxis response regulator protein-glutamate methylesterase [Deltaproteobacteria bacterium RBG_13_61_14]